MTDPPTYPGPPIDLLLGFPDDPPPVASCGVCAALGKERGEARAGGDGSRVSDLNVEIRNHPHAGREGASP